MPDSDDILREQLRYYNARAQEYDATAWFSEPCDADFSAIIAMIHAGGRVDHALELACGTGAWTSQLVKITQSITAIDGAPEMIATNRAKLGDDPRVTYQQADLFAWTPTQTYDLVLFGFFLSHIPPDKLPNFLDQVASAVKVGGRVLMIDEHAGGRQVSGPVPDGIYQMRTLQDGSTYQIVKVYYDPASIQDMLAARGLGEFTLFKGECFFALEAVNGGW